MNSRSLAFMIGVLVFTKLAVPIWLDAQEHAHYKLIDLGTFGGPNSYLSVPDGSYGQVLNNQGLLTGWADTLKPDPFPNFCFDQDCFVARAFQWQNGVRSKLSGLARGLSSQTTWISSNGIIAGISQNGQIDPSFPGFPVTHGVIWKDGVVTDLGTLDGGFESAALAVNSHGQVVGAADNTVPDATSMYAFNWGWLTQTRAFLWQDGIMQDLHTLGGPDAVAYLINDNGQVAGASYLNSKPSEYCAKATDGGFSLTTGAFLWENGKMQNLGNFGGTCTGAFDMNDNGQVIGSSTLQGDQEQHPFVWDNGTLKDLGTFGGSTGAAIAINNAGTIVGWADYAGDQLYRAALWNDSGMTDLGTLEIFSFAQAVNAHGQVVGFSTDDQFNNHQGFLWQKGEPMVALNSLVSSSLLDLTDPAVINDRGEIAGTGMDSAGNQHAFLLIPCDKDHPGFEGCDDSMMDPVDAEVSRKGSMQLATQSGTLAAPSTSPNGLDHAMLPAVASGLSSAGRSNRAAALRSADLADEHQLWRGGTVSLNGDGSTRKCQPKGEQCPSLPGYACCRGLVCVAAGNRSRCE